MIMKQINEIIQVEAPISFSQLTARIIESWSFSRSGAKIEQVINELVEQMSIIVTMGKNRNFITIFSTT